MAVTRLGTDEQGRPVVRKQAEAADAEGIERLRHEAAVLRAAQHPGVVEVAALEDEPEGGVALVLRWAGSRTAADLRLPIDAAARTAAALAATVADLHALGIRHGAIRPDHVVVDDAGRPVLCGFGSATADAHGPGSTAGDVAGVGSVVRALAGPDVEVEPIPERRFGRHRSFAGMTRRALLTLADQATADDPERRPTARALAASLAGVVPERPAAASAAGEAPARRRFDPPFARHASRPDPDDVAAVRRPAVGWAVAAVGAAVLATAGVRAASGGGSADAPVARPVRVPVDAAAVAACPPVSAALAVDHDGDGCGSAAAVADGVVAVDGTRYGVGLEGDVILMGDWDCDGFATVAALRPRTGEVFVFDGWAEPGEDLVVGARTQVAGAVSLEGVDPDADGCPSLVAVGPAGQRTEVPA